MLKKTLIITLLLASGLTSFAQPRLSPIEKAELAAKELEEAKNDPAFLKAMDEAHQLFESQSYEQAIAKYEEASKLRPQNVYPSVIIYDIQLEMGKPFVEEEVEPTEEDDLAARARRIREMREKQKPEATGDVVQFDEAAKQKEAEAMAEKKRQERIKRAQERLAWERAAKGDAHNATLANNTTKEETVAEVKEEAKPEVIKEEVVAEVKEERKEEKPVAVKEEVKEETKPEVIKEEVVAEVKEERKEEKPVAVKEEVKEETKPEVTKEKVVAEVKEERKEVKPAVVKEEVKETTPKLDPLKMSKEEFQTELAKQYKDGVTESTYKEGNATVIERIVVQSGKGNQYKKVTHKWGGVFYFKNGISTPQRVWDQETVLK